MTSCEGTRRHRIGRVRACHGRIRYGTYRERLRLILEILLDETSSEEEDLSKRSRMDAKGHHVRQGGWHSKPKQFPELKGQAAWRHNWVDSKLNKMLLRTDTYDENGYGGKLFRSRTGVPRKLFDVLLDEAKGYVELQNHEDENRRGPRCIPMQIKLCATLNWMRQGGSFTSAADLADVAVETLRRFAVMWAHAVVKHDYPKHVRVPEGEKLAEDLQVHAKLGFPGMLAGTDGVAVQVSNTPWVLKQKHKGKDTSISCRSFNVSGTARKRVIHVHGSHPAGDNDKTMAKFDTFLQGVKNLTIGDKETFMVYTCEEGDGNPEHMSGLWIMTDNGYHRWRCTQFPSKHPIDNNDLIWSARAESVRKPSSECIFGIIKVRFLLFAGVFDFGRCGMKAFEKRVAHFDSLFRVACMLHNRLQDHDNISDLGTRESDWKDVNFGLDKSRRLARMQQVAGAGGILPGTRNALLAESQDVAEYEASHDKLHAKLCMHFQHAKHESK